MITKCNVHFFIIFFILYIGDSFLDFNFSFYLYEYAQYAVIGFSRSEVQ